MPSPPAILALIVGVAGWYYLFYSTAARRLDGIEPPTANQRRSILRKFNGAAMLILGAAFYAGFKFDPHLHPIVFLTIWVSVLILLIIIIALAVLDLRLTARLRKKS